MRCPTCGVMLTQTLLVTPKRPPTQFANAAVTVGLAGLCFPICGPVALVLGLIGLAKNRDSRGAALTGIALGSISTLFIIVIVTLGALGVINPPWSRDP